jgi:transcriptional regulator with XRE-family HTH domain
LLLDIGTAVRDARQNLGWSQADLARRCGLSQATVSNVERCDGDASIGTVGAVLDALSIRPELRLRSPFVDRRPQRDVVHRPCVAYVGRRLEAAGWAVESEVEVTDDRMHGWVDILAFDRTSGCVIVGEVKTELHDLGEIERTMGWYERLAWRASARFAGAPDRWSGSCSSWRPTQSRDGSQRTGTRSGGRTRSVARASGPGSIRSRASRSMDGGSH